MATDANVIEVDDDSFEREVLSSKLPVLVDVGATWCGPCKVLAPIVARVAVETAGRAKVVTMDADAAPKTAQRYGVRGVPTLLVFQNGERVASHVGVTSKEKIHALLERGAARPGTSPATVP